MPPTKVMRNPTTQGAVAYSPSVTGSMPMRGAITPGANIAQAVSICSAVMAISAGKIGGACGTDFESGGAGDSISSSGGADGRGHFGSRGRRGARTTGARHAGRYLPSPGRAPDD